MVAVNSSTHTSFVLHIMTAQLNRNVIHYSQAVYGISKTSASMYTTSGLYRDTRRLRLDGNTRKQLFRVNA